MTSGSSVMRQGSMSGGSITLADASREHPDRIDIGVWSCPDPCMVTLAMMLDHIRVLVESHRLRERSLHTP